LTHNPPNRTHSLAKKNSFALSGDNNNGIAFEEHIHGHLAFKREDSFRNKDAMDYYSTGHHHLDKMRKKSSK